MNKLLNLKNLLVLSLLAVSLTSHAALFDDKEARKKILDVEATSIASDKAHQAEIDALKQKQDAIEKRLAAIEAVLQGQGLLALQNQIEELKQELAQLKGDLELANHNIENTQIRQKDLYTDTDTRLRRIEAGPVSDATNGAAAAPVAEDAKAFAAADELSKANNYKDAFTAYDSFIKAYPESALVPDALYGLGYAQFALKNYKSSIATQQKLIDGHPDSVKAPDGMYNMANSQIQLRQVTNAKKTLKELIAKYPNAEIIPSAQKRLKALEALK
jgi:tol-pal system protein YbgF